VIFAAGSARICKDGPVSEPKRTRGTAAERRERQRGIVDFVVAAGSRTVDEIAQAAGVSAMTAYRDVDELEAQGLLRRTHGAVTAAASQAHEAVSAYRIAQNLDEKEALARRAFEFVQTGTSLILDDSSTGIPLARLLSDKAPLTVITNYNPVARILEEDQDIRLILTGGQYERWADAYFGPAACQAVRALHADTVIMSTSAIVGDVCHHPSEAPAEIKRTMLEAATTKILYADHTKFRRTALHAVAPVAAFDIVIVDAATEAPDLALLRRTGAQVVVA
jgi:DeoR/GlpR family transcriptional regulator of sugar metabolism